MAKIPFMKGFEIIPEGETVLRIKSIDDSKYKSFGKFSIVLEDYKGRLHTQTFSTLKNNGEENVYALMEYGTFVYAALGDDADPDEVETEDLVGHYIRCTVTHEDVLNEKTGRTNTYSRISRVKYPAEGFDEVEEQPKQNKKSSFNLDDILK